ncbi:ferric-dicitrate binding protein FerR (iron transport regulator) [Chitinophaga dinghuensis]|uniref:Ferric-dicitrate binding protein FerR (Iron transport regulator) n=1 Tax=Chitinophaga dinghuensis TaxID=1539050 RepID=A0A327VJV5_9BACT|nr:FecR domain-containing protein [Chitinophaga dinghuensis]RAJ74990.1 ferric-dicitrate binding protein FerR (iron transport regulator) [Chitinophaga dinghuensis]
MGKDNYTSYTKEQFLEDAFFLDWVRYARPEAVLFWEQWQQEGPANLEEMLAAKSVAAGIFRLERISSPETIKSAVWHNIQAGIATAGTPTRVVSIRRRIMKWAAAILAPVALAGGYYLYANRTKHFSTGNGQHMLVTLPDASTVMLNANSSLAYAKWNSAKREVWIEGEALFDVKPSRIQLAAPFTVHAGKLNVEVLGTVFNIKSRRNRTEVYLQTGKVRVTDPEHHTSIVLSPDEKVRYDITNYQLMKIPSSGLSTTAWKENKMELVNTSVKEIFEALQDQYGYAIVLQDSSIANKTIQGTLSLRNINTVLFELSAILNVTIDKNNDTLTIRKNGQRGY